MNSTSFSFLKINQFISEDLWRIIHRYNSEWRTTCLEDLRIIFFRIVDHKKYRYKNLSKFLCAVNCKHLYSLLFINKNFPSELPPHLKHANMAFINAAYRCLVCNASSHSTHKTEKKTFLLFYFIRKLAKTNNCYYGVYNLYIHVYIMQQ